MARFLFGKKKQEDTNTFTCACSGKHVAEETKPITNTNGCCSQPNHNIDCIKVLGSGCKSCHELYENVKLAVKHMGLSVPVEYVKDMQKVMEYGVMRMPALVVNEKVVSMGKVEKTDDVETLLCMFDSTNECSKQ